jgi:HEAT repeats
MYSKNPSNAAPKQIPWEAVTMTHSELESARIALFHSSPDARRYAMRFLGDCRDAESYDKVLWLITKGTEPPEVMRDGLTTLHKINPEKALEILLGRSGVWNPDFSVRERVVLLLGNYAKTPELVGKLIDQMGDSSWGVRLAVCQTLGKWCASEAKSILQQRRSVDTEQVVRLAADEALRAIFRAEGR